MVIPHFITNSLDLSPSMQSSEVLMLCLVEINSFYENHKVLNGFPKDDEETRDLIKFLWAASMVKVTSTIYIDSSDPHVLEWAKKLHT